MKARKSKKRVSFRETKENDVVVLQSPSKVDLAKTKARPLKLVLSSPKKAEAMDTPAEEAVKLSAAYSKHINNFYTHHRSLLAEPDAHVADETTPQEEEDAGNSADNAAAVDCTTPEGASALLSDIRKLSEETLRVCDNAAALPLVPASSLISLCKILTVIVNQGDDTLLAVEDGEDEVRSTTVLAALEAGATALRIMVASNAPQQVLNEDLIDLIIDMTRFQLLHNAYPFLDGRFRAANRPELIQQKLEDAEPVQKKRKKAGKTAHHVAIDVKPPPILSLLVDRLQVLIGLLADLFPAVQLQPACLPPLLRCAAGSLTVQGVLLLQAKSISLLAAAFYHYSDLRKSLLDDVFSHVVPFIDIPTGSKAHKRDFVASADGTINIHMFTAALLLIIQSSVDLPDMDSPPDSLPQCYASSARYGDYFWNRCFERLGKKSEGDPDIKIVMEMVLQDLIAVQHSPEWPAASVLLLRFMAAINAPRGMQHSDAAVRQASVDLLGGVTAQMHADELLADDDEQWLSETAIENGFHDGSEAARSLLLRYLADASRAVDSNLAKARTFMLTKALAEEATELKRVEASEEEMHDLLFKYRQQREELDTFTFADGLSHRDASRLMRASNRNTFGKARFSLLQWLLEASDPKLQFAPTTRAKAIKALGEVVQANTRLLEAPTVHAAVDRALGDESISVREAAVALLGKHIQGNTELTLHLFPTLVKASMDTGTSVRKVAIKLLWECCIRVSGFPKAAEAARHVLMRANDLEDSIQDWVARVFHSLWFTPKLEGELTVSRSAEERAEQLADVAMAVYEAGGKNIHLPLDSTHPMVTVLKAAMHWGSKGDMKRVLKAGRQISSALLEAVLRCAESNDDPEAAFPYLLSLHALSVTEVALCMKDKDPSCFIRSLAPYLKSSAPPAGSTMDAQRRSAELLLCILYVVDSIVGTLPRCDSTTAGEMVEDLANLINRHTFTQVMAGAAKCLCSVATKHEEAARKLAGLCMVYQTWLASPAQNYTSQHISRFLFISGHLCRYGANIIEQTSLDGGHSPPLAMRDCLAAFVKHCSEPIDAKVQESALWALGSLAIARPAILVADNSRAKALLKAALVGSAAEPLKMRALANLTELLRAESEALKARQAEMDGGRGKREQKTLSVPSQNGIGDILSQGGAIVQDNWDLVLALAMDTTPVSAGASTSPGSRLGGAGSAVRRCALEVIEVVLRNGLVGPWTAVPSLVVLATDPSEDVRNRALRALKQLAGKYSKYFDAERLAEGLAKSKELHHGLATACGRPWNAVHVRPVLIGMRSVYSQLIQPNKQLRSDFLRALMRKFRGASEVASSQNDVDMELLSFLTSAMSSLPFKRGDEVCYLVQEINAIISTRCEDIKHSLEYCVEGIDDAVFPTAQCTASIVISMLLVLKEFLKASYSINPERIAAYGGAADKKRQEERTSISMQDGVPFLLEKVDLEACTDQMRTLEHIKFFKDLVKRDAADYDHNFVKKAFSEEEEEEEYDGASDEVLSFDSHGTSGGMRTSEKISSRRAGGKGVRKGSTTIRRARAVSRKRKSSTTDEGSDEDDGLTPTRKRLAL